MDQSFEYYTVEPTTLADVKKIDDIITGSSFDRDSDVQTLGSATIDATKSIGESYIQVLSLKQFRWNYREVSIRYSFMPDTENRFRRYH